MADIFTYAVPTGLGGCGVAGCYKYIAPDGAAANEKCRSIRP
jgi:hypothetical protein